MAKRYRKNNPEKVRATAKSSYLKNRDKNIAKRRAYYVSNREYFKEYYKSKYWADPVAARKAKMEDHRKHRAERLTVMELKRQTPEHKAYMAAYRKKWREQNAEKIRSQNLARWVKKKGATIGSKVEYAVVYERAGGSCYLCGLTVERGTGHLDHVIPVIDGGEHSYRNVQLTHAKCNNSKGVKSLNEYLERTYRRRAAA